MLPSHWSKTELAGAAKLQLARAEDQAVREQRARPAGPQASRQKVDIFWRYMDKYLTKNNSIQFWS
jgi:hypothetical protein